MKTKHEYKSKKVEFDVLITAYYADNLYDIKKITFEKDVFTKEKDEVSKHHLTLVLNQSRAQDKTIVVPRKNVSLYNVKFLFSSDKYSPKKFNLPSVQKYKTFEFKYLKNDKLKQKEVKYEDKNNPPLNNIYSNPFSFHYFRDFLKMYNPSTKNHPIDIDKIYLKRRYCPDNEFEKFLFCSNSKLDEADSSILDNIRDIYMKNKLMKVQKEKLTTDSFITSIQNVR